MQPHISILYTLLSLTSFINTRSECLKYEWNNSDQQKLKPSALSSGDYFGHAVAARKDVIAIGAHLSDNPTSSGTVYIFRLSASSQQYELEQQLKASDADNGDYFGESVWLSDAADVVVIGAPLEDTPAGNAGAAYIFRFDESTKQWNQEQKLEAADAASGDQFGNSVAIETDVCIIGAFHDGSNHGAVYVFRYDSTLKQWAQEQKLTASDASNSDMLGKFISISNNTIIAGAWGVDSPGDHGAAYVFRYNEWTQHWDEEQKLEAPDAGTSDLFGISVGIWDDVLVSCPYGDDDIAANSGAAYVFRYNPSNEKWEVEQKLKASDPAGSDYLGWSVAIEKDVIAVASYADNEPSNSGSVYVFRYNPDTLQWDEETKLKAFDADNSDYFGFRVSISNGIIAVGSGFDDDPSESGAAYVYYGTCVQNPTLDPTLDPTLGPTLDPTLHPTNIPTDNPSTRPPTNSPTSPPSRHPTNDPSPSPTAIPTPSPTQNPTNPGTLSCGDRNTGQYNAQLLDFEVLLPYRGDLTFDISASNFTVKTISATFGTAPQGSFVAPPQGSLVGTVRLPNTIAGIYKFTVEGNGGSVSSAYTVAIVCESESPTGSPTDNPSRDPTGSPSNHPSSNPSNHPSSNPTINPSNHPSIHPSNYPSNYPSNHPSVHPSNRPTRSPTGDPTTTAEPNANAITASLQTTAAANEYSDNSGVDITFDLVSGYFVVALVVLVPMLIMLFAVCFHLTRPGTDKPLYLSLFKFFSSIGDFYTDAIWSLTVYSDPNNNQLWIYAMAFTFGAHILSIMVGFVYLTKWRQSRYKYIQRYAEKRDKFMIVLLLISGFYATVDIVTSHLFHLDALSLQITEKEKLRISYLKIMNNVVLENIPCFIIQYLYLQSIVISTDSILSNGINITLLAMAFSVISIVFGLLTVILRLVNESISISRSKGRETNSIVVDFCLTAKECGIFQSYHVHTQKKLSNAITLALRIDKSQVKIKSVYAISNGIKVNAKIRSLDKANLKRIRDGLYAKKELFDDFRRECVNKLKLDKKSGLIALDFVKIQRHSTYGEMEGDDEGDGLEDFDDETTKINVTANNLQSAIEISAITPTPTTN